MAANPAHNLLNPDLLLSLPTPLARLIGSLRQNQHGFHEMDWYGHPLRSVFQPIVSLTHSRVVGHEALLRPGGLKGEPMPPPEFFQLVERQGGLGWVDRAARAMHVLNAGQTPGWLFLNFHPGLFELENTDRVSAQFLHFLIDLWGVNPHRMVLEVVEGVTDNPKLMEYSARGLKEFGVGLALDDFGAGASNFDRIWDLEPEFVKLDMSFAARAVSDAKIRRLLPRVVEMLHDSGAQVVLEGIETAEQAQLAIEANVDFGQGYYLARPQPAPLADQDALAPLMEQIWQGCAAVPSEREIGLKAFLDPALAALEQAAEGMRSMQGFDAMAVRFLDLHAARRIYLVDMGGRICRGPLAAACRGREGVPCQQCDGNCPAFKRHRFDPVEAPESCLEQARLCYKPYFRRALESPGRMAVSPPYISFYDGKSIVTISRRISIGREYYVLCGDLDWLSLNNGVPENRTATAWASTPSELVPVFV